MTKQAIDPLRMKKPVGIPRFLLMGIIALLTACTSNSTITQTSIATDTLTIERPREAWVVRSVLDLRPRMLSIALHSQLWVAYNTQTAGLYKAWTGGINFDGPVYTSAHGPQPTTVGTTYSQEPDGSPWKVIENEHEIIPQIQYKGHTILNGHVRLKYELHYQGKVIKLEEMPEFFPLGDGQVGLTRTFKTEGVPAGTKVVLSMNLGSLRKESDYQTDGTFAVLKSSPELVGQEPFLAISGNLTLNNKGNTTFSVHLTPKPTVAQPSEQSPKREQVVEALFAKSDCNTCHNRDVKTVGPAYVAIAERYTNTSQNRTKLVEKVIKGGAGSWGPIPMTPHPDLSQEDATLLVDYILALDEVAEKKASTGDIMPKADFKVVLESLSPVEAKSKAPRPGIAFNAYQFAGSVNDFPEINGEMPPVFSGSANAIHLEDNGFGELKENFVVHATGFIHVNKTTNVVLRLVSDDGSRLYVGDQLVVDNGGNHALEAREGEMILKAGKTPFKIEYYQGGGGRGLSLQWRPYGTNKFVVIPPSSFSFQGTDIKKTATSPVVVAKEVVPGDAAPLLAVHPSFTLTQARPSTFQPKVGGMDFLPDGRLVVSTWDSLGSVFILEGVQGNNPENIKVKRVAFGLAEPLGLKVVDGDIYVLQKQELTRLVDLNKDDLIDEYQTVCNGWQVSANFHEFAFGLVYKEGYFYGALATAINPGGASTQPQIPDRGKVVKIAKKDGSFELIATGLRTPNGINFGVDNEIFIADNQGDWLPASKIVHLQEGAWYGSRSVDFKATAHLKEKLPVVWLPQDEIGNSPSQPAKLDVGPYKNQMIHGDVTHGGIKRVFAEKVNGQYQGAVFRFTQGLEAGINRLVWGPDGVLYAGGVGSTGNWGHAGKLGFGLQRLAFNNKVTFEMLAVRAKANGIEIELTEALKEGLGNKTSDYTIRQFYFKPTAEYGGPKLDDKQLAIESITVSPDRKKVLLTLAGMKPQHVLYVRLNRKTLTSQSGQSLWSTEAWYTMNTIPVNQ